MYRPILAAATLFALCAVASAQQPAMPAGAPGNPLHPQVKMETSLGDIVFELDAEKAPISVMNFVRYAEEGFYNGTIFHRVIPVFMIQGGGYTPDLEEKKATHEPIKNEWKNGLKNATGTIAMARTQAPDSATAQFYINVVDNVRLDQPNGGAAYAVFGKIVQGMDVVEKIKTTKLVAHPKYPSGEGAVTPETPVVIKSVKLISAFDKSKVEASMKAAMDAAKKAEEDAKAGLNKTIADLVKKSEDELKAKAGKTESGVYYITIKEGTGPSPTPNDTVQVNYKGTLADGKEFDSSYRPGRGPFTSPLRSLIPAWGQALPNVKTGGKTRLIIPPDQGYGERGAPPDIPPNAILIFDIELLAVTPAPVR